jgi:L-2-hydroxyglutarate oxidase LhgO
MSDRFDVVVVGAGIVGLAVARELLARHPATRVAVLEKEDAPARHQTGHNSGVIHSGVYYQPGSAKARLCVRGAELLVRYCESRGVRFERRGKVVVAATEGELAGLVELHRRGVANGLQDLRVLDPQELRELEPHVRGLRALHVPSAGIVDYVAVAAALAEDVRSFGGAVRFETEVRDISVASGEIRLGTSAGEVIAARVVGCAGLWSDRLAVRAGGPPTPRIVPFRGDYYVLRSERRDLVRGLIYRVPDPRFPFLGVHFTRRLDGSVWLGPNAVLAFARDGYRRTDVRIADVLDALASRGFRRLAARYWRTGLAELWRDVSKGAFLAELRRYVPELRADDLRPGPSGVRAQALGDDGTLLDDFVIDVIGRFVNVRNAPSPAATSSLAIAAEIVDAIEAAA